MTCFPANRSNHTVPPWICRTSPATSPASAALHLKRPRRRGFRRPQEIPLYDVTAGTGRARLLPKYRKSTNRAFDLRPQTRTRTLNVPERLRSATRRHERRPRRHAAIFFDSGHTEDARLRAADPPTPRSCMGRPPRQQASPRPPGAAIASRSRFATCPADRRRRSPCRDPRRDRTLARHAGTISANGSFGRRGNNHILGARLIPAATTSPSCCWLLGSPDPDVDDMAKATREARRLFDEKQNDESMKHWPRRCGDCDARVLARLMKTHKPNAASARDRQRNSNVIWVSALQS